MNILESEAVGQGLWAHRKLLETVRREHQECETEIVCNS
jgi:hypothetical protein